MYFGGLPVILTYLDNAAFYQCSKLLLALYTTSIIRILRVTISEPQEKLPVCKSIFHSRSPHTRIIRIPLFPCIVLVMYLENKRIRVVRVREGSESE